MGEYKDFQDCVNKNQDKSNPDAYCGEIKARTEKSENCPCKIRILKSDTGRFIIYGPASVEIIDREGDKIRAQALADALPQLLKAARFSRNHEDLIVGEILSEYTTPDGQIFKTEVVKDRLMVVGEIWDNTRAAKETREQILSGNLGSYSISGEKIKSKDVCDGDAWGKSCYRDISKLDLHAVTICEQGMNPDAKFQVLQKQDYILIATPHTFIEASDKTKVEKEAEGTKLPDATTTPPAAQEAKKEDAPPGAVTGNGGGVESKIDQLINMMGQMMQAMGGGGMMKSAPATDTKTKPPTTEPPAADPAKPAPVGQGTVTVSVSKAEYDDLKTKYDALSKKVEGFEELTKAIQAGNISQTPRIRVQKAGQNDTMAAIVKDPSRLDKMSYEELRELRDAGGY